MAKVKCKVLKRFNGNDPGSEVTAPSMAVAQKWMSYGYVEVIKDVEAPVKKVITSPEVKK